MALMDIPDLEAATRSVARVLADGGWFVFSIVHPCYRGHVEAVADYLLDHRYRKPKPPEWLPEHAYHRPLAIYVEKLTSAGLRIERLVERGYADADQGGVPQLLYARTIRLPRRRRAGTAGR